MKRVRLCFLWHMHQPYYKDDSDGQYHMPWVYLHALKDYYELPYYHKIFDKIKGTYNLVPSLLLQLKDYENTDVSDTFIRLIRKPVGELNQNERDILIPQLFMANYKNMVRPLKRYKELYDKKGDTPIFESSSLTYSDEEILDLEVMFLISWCGVYTRERIDIINKLIKQGRNFSQIDKEELIDSLASFISEIVPLYKSLQDSGNIEVSATPFYHPILPILLNPKSAKEALPEISMANIGTDFSEDAGHHVSSAIDYYEAEFGYRPTGMWPAEGSISNEAADLFASKGIKWIASDEDVLSGSIGIPLRDKSERRLLYKKHIYGSSSGDINIFFRDKKLSDLFGFTYSGWDAEKAVDNFMDKLSEIHDSCDFSPIVPVILDGENAWEYYPENANQFFTLLYQRLENCNWVETMTMTEAMNCDTPENRIEDIRAGSWIYANFTTWMGHSEKNEGWRMLSDAHRRFNRKKGELKNRDQIQKELYIAEGSDWFWWYGDDHFSLQSDTFDKLFRNHIANIYTLMGEQVPADVTKPIKRSYRSGLIKKPASKISPVIDGEITSFYEWMGAGKFDLKFDAGAMTASGNRMSTLYFGFDNSYLYLRLDGDFSNIKGHTFEIEITWEESKIFQFDTFKENENFKCSNVAEFKIDRELIGDEKVLLSFRLKSGQTVIETAPLYNSVEIDFKDNDRDWIV